MCVLVAQSCLTLQPHGLYSTMLLCPWDFSGKEYRNGLPLSTPGHLPNSGIKLTSLVSPALAGRLFTTVLPGKPYININIYIYI